MRKRWKATIRKGQYLQLEGGMWVQVKEDPYWSHWDFYLCEIFYPHPSGKIKRDLIVHSSPRILELWSMRLRIIGVQEERPFGWPLSLEEEFFSRKGERRGKCLPSRRKKQKP